MQVSGVGEHGSSRSAPSAGCRAGTQEVAQRGALACAVSRWPSREASPKVATLNSRLVAALRAGAAGGGCGERATAVHQDPSPHSL